VRGACYQLDVIGIHRVARAEIGFRDPRLGYTALMIESLRIARGGNSKRRPNVIDDLRGLRWQNGCEYVAQKQDHDREHAS
jgi:hypothetical protein